VVQQTMHVHPPKRKVDRRKRAYAYAGRAGKGGAQKASSSETREKRRGALLRREVRQKAACVKVAAKYALPVSEFNQSGGAGVAGGEGQALLARMPPGGR